MARRQRLVRLTEAAMAVALSVLLGNMRLVELPSGGSIALATLPLLALALTRGVRPALLAGCCAGAAHALAGGTIIHPAQLALDYLVAYAVLAVAGIGAAGVPRGRAGIAPAVLAAMSLHLAAMVASGMIFFAPVAGSAALIYSLSYNATTVVPETLLALWLLPPLVVALARANPADSWRRGLLAPPRLTLRAPRTIHATPTIDTRTDSRPVTPHTSKAPVSLPPNQHHPRPTTLVRSTPFQRPGPFVPRRAAAAMPIAPAEPDDRVGR